MTYAILNSKVYRVNPDGETMRLVNRKDGSRRKKPIPFHQHGLIIDPTDTQLEAMGFLPPWPGMKKAPLFQLGDRVKFKVMGGAFSCTHGQVVYYRGGHDPFNPRVRWVSGWGTTQKARELVALSAEELRTLPAPELTAPNDTRRDEDFYA